MTLEEFKSANKDKTTEHLLNQLVEELDRKGNCRASYTRCVALHNGDEASYWNREVFAINDRATWLHKEILRRISE